MNHLTSMINNKYELKPTLPNPDFQIMGGPFSNSILKTQKILSNSSLYLSLRNEFGNEAIMDNFYF